MRAQPHLGESKSNITQLRSARAYTARVNKYKMKKQLWRLLLFHRDRRGQYLVQTVILLPLLMILVGLVLDGGWMYWQYRRAEIAVNAAAQAASHAIDVDHFRETNEVRLDDGEAYGAASGYVNINQRGQMQVTCLYISPNRVFVSANAQVQTIFFRLAGISSLTMRVEGQAYPAFGINREGQ